MLIRTLEELRLYNTPHALDDLEPLMGIIDNVEKDILVDKLGKPLYIALCSHYKNVDNIPGMIAAIERFFRVKEGVHFGWGRPPKGIPSPILKPKTYDNVLWFANGTIWQVISLATPGSANGLSVTSIIADECKFMSKAAIDAEVMPTLSGITHPDNSPAFSDYNPLYKSTFFASDASLTAKGSWLEREEEKLDLEITDGKLKGRRARPRNSW